MIITYHWPPAGGSGVQRWLKFVKYLPQFGVQPVVFCPKDARYPKLDESLQKEIPAEVEGLRHPVKDFSKLIFSKKKSSSKGTSNLTNNKLLSFIRGNFFIPDAKVSWVNSAFHFLIDYLKNNTVDAIVTTGPPHSMHLIGLALKNRLDIPWIADFRDPWTDLYYTKEFNQLSFARNRSKRLEAKVLRKADVVLTVSQHIKGQLEMTSNNVQVITNGFDDETNIDIKPTLDSCFSMSYIGLLPKSSIPHKLFEVIQELNVENADFKKDFKLKFVGDINDEVKNIIDRRGLDSQTEFMGYVPHEEAIKLQHTSQVLLLLIPNVPNNEGILTGKLFEYLAAKRPILAIGPRNGDLAKVLEETNAGMVVDFHDTEKIKSSLQSFYEQFKNDQLKVQSKNIEQFHRKNLTSKLVEVLKEVTA